MTNIASTTFELSSGFTISVQPLPPYYTDFINDELPLQKYPKRKLTLAGGDVLEIDYKPPEEPVDAANTEEYELYVLWHSVDASNKEIAAKRDRAKRDFLLASCVTIDDGPISVEDDSWLQNLETAFDKFAISKHAGKRRVLFLKACVIRTLTEYEAIIKSALYPEVTMQGITNALHSFRSDVGQPASRKRHARQS